MESQTRAEKGKQDNEETKPSKSTLSSMEQNPPTSSGLIWICNVNTISSIGQPAAGQLVKAQKAQALSTSVLENFAVVVSRFTYCIELRVRLKMFFKNINKLKKNFYKY
ncbi:unnamed protein product, partial [Vitis vinifera]